jgi:hypothetical protein
MKLQKYPERNLCSVAEVQQYVNNTTSSLTSFIQSSISAVSQSFSNYVGGISEQTYTEYYDGTGTNMLMIMHTPITSISSVQYQLYPTGTFLNFYEGSLSANIQYDDGGWIELYDIRFYQGKNNIKIVYSAGYSTIPADIKQACIEEVAMLMDNSNVTGVGKGNLGIKNKSSSNETYSFENISSSTEKVLDYYRKIIL